MITRCLFTLLFMSAMVDSAVAQSVTVIRPGSGGPNWGYSWAIILLSVILGLLLTLKSSGRKTEVKRR